MDLDWSFYDFYWWFIFNNNQSKNNQTLSIMKKQLLFVPSIIFFFILLVFFYLLTIDRDPKQIPSILIEKKVPDFETQSLLNNRKWIIGLELNRNLLTKIKHRV